MVDTDASGEAHVFPFNSETADQVLASAMASEFAGRPISKVSIPNSGYQVQIQFALDSHNVVAYMIPSRGIYDDGTSIGGYYFEVSHSGTMPITGSARASSLFDRIIANASAISRPIPMAQN